MHLNANQAVVLGLPETQWTIHVNAGGHFEARPTLVLQPLCWACGKPGPGLASTADGRRVHRWPCRDRLR